MKKILVSIFLVSSLFGIAEAQSYKNPESMVYDASNNRYFISNKGGNTIVQLDSQGKLTNFVSNDLDAPKGLLLIGDTLVSVNNTSIQGFNIENATRLFKYSIVGSAFMNDVTTDNEGYLYVSDSKIKCIYKVKLQDGSYSTLIDSGISPNGLLFDKKNNSLIICNWEKNARIQTFSLTDSSLTTMITTNFSNLDGLARDKKGNIYVSSWGANSVYVFDPLFVNPPKIVATGYDGPADISIDRESQVLAIPIFKSDTIDLVTLKF